MQFSKRRRITLVFVLVAVLCSLFVTAGIDRPPASSLGTYPGAEDIAQQPDKYEKQRVSLVGRVVLTDPVVVNATYGTDAGLKSTQLNMVGINTTVEQGNRLQVFGVLINSQTIRVLNSTVIPQTERVYAWVISFVAALWVLARIINQWNINYDTGAFHPRSVSIVLRFFGSKDN